MRWERVNRRDRYACALADRHYSRTVIGAPQVGSVAALCILMTPARDALWITAAPRFTQHEWPDTWQCTLFRNESSHLSSELIAEAVAATRYLWGEPPAGGIITFVDPKRTRRKRDPGRCYRRAGWRVVGVTKVQQLVTLQQCPADMPEPAAPLSHFGF